MRIQTIFKAVFVGAAAKLLLAAPAQATLLGRDLSGNAVANNSASAVFFLRHRPQHHLAA